MAIEKAMLSKTGATGPEKVMDVMFNPETYSIDNKIIYTDVADMYGHIERPKYSRMAARVLSLDLLFDTTSVWRDSAAATLAGSLLKAPGVFSKTVLESIDLIHSLYEIDSTGEPPIVAFSWSNFRFVGVIESVKETFTEFSGSGDPVKAKVGITIKERLDLKPTYFNMLDASMAEAALASSEGVSLEAAVNMAVEAIQLGSMVGGLI